jgi:hypothetical protein
MRAIAAQRENERTCVLLAMDRCAATSPPVTVPTAMQGPRTAYHVLAGQDVFPVSLKTGWRARRRCQRIIEELREEGLIEVVEYRRANRHFASRLGLTTQGEGRCAIFGIGGA